MPAVEIGAVCENGHFTYAFHQYPPVTAASVDKQVERRVIPDECSQCGASLDGRPMTVEGSEIKRPVRSGGLSRSSGAKKPKVGPLPPAAWKKAVWERQAREQGRPGKAPVCAVTGEQLNFLHDHAHHPLEKRLLKARGLHHLMYDPRNGMFIKARVHTAHTDRGKPISAEYVPACAFAFAREVGHWAIARLESDHPQPKEQ